MAQRVLILGAAGRDFHNFNVHFRDNPDYHVVAFTAAQIPNIENRRYPAELAGAHYPDGIPILPERDVVALVHELAVDVVVFSYSDVTYTHVMRLGAQVMAAGADYMLLGPKHTMLSGEKPVIAVCAARTGAGKSQTSRRVATLLRGRGLRVSAVRHPMPYGDLARQAVQRFASAHDLDDADVTIEEREEYEPYIELGLVVYAGVDYARILAAAQAVSDVIIWDGGNNDLPFIRPDLWLTVVDPHRPDHAVRYYPGEINVINADVVIINKVETAGFEAIEETRRIVRELNPDARIVDAASPIFVENGAQIRGQRVLVIEDGPTLTHGEMAYGAGWVAAQRYGAAAIVDPRHYAVGALAETFAAWPNTGAVLPAMGYGPGQVADLEATIRATPADLVLVATPIDLRRLIAMDKPALRVRYELQEIGEPTLDQILADFIAGNMVY